MDEAIIRIKVEGDVEREPRPRASEPQHTPGPGRASTDEGRKEGGREAAGGGFEALQKLFQWVTEQFRAKPPAWAAGATRPPHLDRAARLGREAIPTYDVVPTHEVLPEAPPPPVVPEHDVLPTRDVLPEILEQVLPTHEVVPAHDVLGEILEQVLPTHEVVPARDVLEEVLPTYDVIPTHDVGLPPRGMQAGGPVPQPTGNSGKAKGTDSVPAMLTPGEWVVPAGPAARHRSLLEKISGEPMASGGPVQYLQGGGMAHAIAGLIGGPAPLILAGLEVLDRLGEAVGNATRAVGRFAQVLADPQASVAGFIQGMGQSVAAISGLVPGLGLFGQAIGGATDALAGFMGALDGMANRYAQVSPAIAAAQAQAEVTQMLGDFRRAQELGPSLVSYIQARTEMQQKIEDMKVRFIVAVMPAVETAIKILEALLPMVEQVVQGVTNPASLLPGVTALVDLSRSIQEWLGRSDATDMDPTTAALAGYIAPGARHPGPHVETPRL